MCVCKCMCVRLNRLCASICSGFTAHMHSTSHMHVYPVYGVCPVTVSTHTAMCTAGIGPWKLAMLSVCLYLWDIAWGVEKPSFQEEWMVRVGHVERSYLLLSKIFHRIRPASVCSSDRRQCVAFCCTVYTNTALHECRCRAHCIHATTVCEGVAGRWCLGTAGQEAADRVRRTAPHRRAPSTAEWLHLH